MAQVVYLGKLGELTGSTSETLPLPPGISSAGALRFWLDDMRGFGGALKQRTVRIAVNAMLVPDGFTISDSDEIAFLPPVGGG
jgi:molybdopterin synthase sulfur carrier subunit